MRQQFTPDVTTWFLVVSQREHTGDAVASGIQRQQFTPDDLPGSWLLSAACGLRANGDHGIWHQRVARQHGFLRGGGALGRFRGAGGGRLRAWDALAEEGP